MAILSVGLVGAMRVFPVGLRASQRAETSSRATLAAQRTIESLKLKSWEELAEGESTVSEAGFSVVTRIALALISDVIDPTRLKVIEVTVQSTPSGGRPTTLTFVTYVRHGTS